MLKSLMTYQNLQFLC